MIWIVWLVRLLCFGLIIFFGLPAIYWLAHDNWAPAFVNCVIIAVIWGFWEGFEQSHRRSQ